MKKTDSGWSYWYVRKGGYWATVKMVNGVTVHPAYAAYTQHELMHYIVGIEGGYDNSPSPSVVPYSDILIPENA